MVVTCTTPHRVGPIVLHDDLDRYCVPTSTDLDALGLRIAGRCSVDKPTRNPADGDGVCQHAPCTEFR